MDKIEEILRYIQELCDDRQDNGDMCIDCPFANDSGRCVFKNEYPNEWAIRVRNVTKYVD